MASCIRSRSQASPVSRRLLVCLLQPPDNASRPDAPHASVLHKAFGSTPSGLAGVSKQGCWDLFSGVGSLRTLFNASSLSMRRISESDERAKRSQAALTARIMSNPPGALRHASIRKTSQASPGPFKITIVSHVSPEGGPWSVYHHAIPDPLDGVSRWHLTSSTLPLSLRSAAQSWHGQRVPLRAFLELLTRLSMYALASTARTMSCSFDLQGPRLCDGQPPRILGQG